MKAKTLTVAKREFISTVATKGFIIGVVIFPLIMVGLIFLIPKLIDDTPPRVSGTIEVVDRSGWEGASSIPTIPDQLAAGYSEEALRAEYDMTRRAIEQQAGERLGEAAEAAAGRAIEQAMGEIPDISVAALDPDKSEDAIEERKRALLEGTPQDGGLLAIVLIEPNAVRPSDELGFGSYQITVRPRLDDRFERPLQQKIEGAIRTSRIAAAGQDPEALSRLVQVRSSRPQVMTETGERASTGGGANMAMAGAFMFLLWISVMTGGQYLMTTVIEEKSSRVMEVLLSAVSPVQLMTGKILGQMCVALTVLLMYVTIAILTMRQFDLLHLVDAGNIGLLIVYFFIAFFMLASLMAAIGSAVTEVHEAQSLLTPVIMVMLIPLILWMPLMRSPNSTFATVCGLLPPISPFAMVIRLAGAEPIPAWQVVASILIGIAAVFVFVWATAKIFRIGVLMYGKAPNLPTLLRWIRMA
ncbi:MAG: ABC transporter permease [Phycisphaerales bacterium]|nr:MAG: ABC transporter permease [Phycisphaerales bacterium]